MERSQIEATEVEKTQAYYEKYHWKITLKRMIKDWRLYLMLLPLAIIFILWRYLPMYGLLISFKEFDIIFKRRTNYTDKDGYDNFNKKVEFINNVVNYIKKLSDQTDTNEYKKSITNLAAKANELGLNGLANKLTNRLNGVPSEINKSKKNNKSF